VDGEYQKRLRIEKGEKKSYTIKIPKKADTHQIEIYKATEATTGNILFCGAKVENYLLPKTENKKRIEFIGNSITSGMGNDFTEIPCGTGEWFDQHNAYWAYGPQLSRELNTDFLLSSVSGIGMYRGWNDENSEEPTMPQVYENLYLTRVNTKPFDTTFQPDLVSICLGTNDLSDGDGIKPRLPFNEEKYISNYIQFINTIFKRYPKTQVVLLNSPMVSGDRNTLLVNCLKKVMFHFESDRTHKKIALFEFPAMQPKGCTTHPDIEDHTIMAKQLAPLFKKLLDEK
jgi:lysophospholipase L1-like esterase